MNNEPIPTKNSEKIETKNNKSPDDSNQLNQTVDIDTTLPVTTKTKKKFRFKKPIIVILVIFAIIGAFFVPYLYTNMTNSIVLCKKVEDLTKDRFPDFNIVGTSYSPAENGPDVAYDAYCSAHIAKKSGNSFAGWVYNDRGITQKYDVYNSNDEFTVLDVYDKSINYDNFSDKAKNNLVNAVNNHANSGYPASNPDGVVIMQISKNKEPEQIEVQAVKDDMSVNKNRKYENYYFIEYDLYYFENDNWIFIKKAW